VLEFLVLLKLKFTILHAQSKVTAFSATRGKKYFEFSSAALSRRVNVNAGLISIQRDLSRVCRFFSQINCEVG
jgi:hypothetical protein